MILRQRFCLIPLVSSTGPSLTNDDEESVEGVTISLKNRGASGRIVALCKSSTGLQVKTGQ